MLHQENKFILILLCSVFFFGCADKSKNTQEEWLLFKKHSIQLASHKLYERVYQAANDSIEKWLFNDLSGYAYWKGNDWRLDSLLCFSNCVNKCIMTLMVRDTLYKPANSDGISYFYGVKIRNVWYFFTGAHMVVPRRFYQKDIHTPLSFEKLKEIATTNIYCGYLKKNQQGEWEINERFFDQVVPVSNLKPRDRLKTEEEYVRFMVEVNWSSDVDETIRKYCLCHSVKLINRCIFVA